MAQIYDNIGNDILVGTADDDTIYTTFGDDTVTGSSGNDRFEILVFNTSDSITITDFVAGGTEDYMIFFSPYPSSNFGFNHVMSTATQVGQNVVFIFPLYAGDYTVTLNNVQLNTLTYADFGFNDVTFGSADADLMIGLDDKSDYLAGLAGDDILDGGSWNDFMEGGDGNDTYYMDNAFDIICEISGVNSGYDIAIFSYSDSFAPPPILPENVEQGIVIGDCTFLRGNSLDNYLYAGGSSRTVGISGWYGDDVIYSSLAGGSYLSGDYGNDTILMHGGNNTAYDGEGNDIYYTYAATDAIVDNFGDGIDTVFSNHDITLGAGLEQLVLYGAGASATCGGDNNIIYANNTNTGVTIDAGGGSDVIFGGANNDNLTGGRGVDLLFGQGGVNTLTGGDDTDIYYFAGGTDTVVETLTGGFDTIYSNNAGITVLAANVEQLILYGAATRGIGTGGNDYIYGNASSNQLILEGGAGNDYLLGGAQNDDLVGGLGSDQLDLSMGGADRLRYYDATGGGNTTDIVYSFDAADASGGHDLIDIGGLGYNAGSIGGAITLADGGAGNTIVAFTTGTLNGTTINLVGVALANMGAGDFVF